MTQLTVERLTGTIEPSYQSASMRWGIETESDARTAYQIRKQTDVIETDFILHPKIFMSGASPDGLIGDDGLLEIKCPNTSTHLETLRTAVIPEKYQLQMLWQMACTGRQWCDFISFDPRFPDGLRLFSKRLERDELRIAELEDQVHLFSTEVDQAITDLDNGQALVGLRSGFQGVAAK